MKDIKDLKDPKDPFSDLKLDGQDLGPLEKTLKTLKIHSPKFNINQLEFNISHEPPKLAKHLRRKSLDQEMAIWTNILLDPREKIYINCRTRPRAMALRQRFYFARTFMREMDRSAGRLAEANKVDAYTINLRHVHETYYLEFIDCKIDHLILLGEDEI